MNNCVKRRRGEKKDHPNQLGNKNKSLSYYRMDATLLFGLLYMRWTYDQIRINREE